MPTDPSQYKKVVRVEDLSRHREMFQLMKARYLHWADEEPNPEMKERYKLMAELHSEMIAELTALIEAIQGR